MDKTRKQATLHFLALRDVDTAVLAHPPGGKTLDGTTTPSHPSTKYLYVSGPQLGDEGDSHEVPGQRHQGHEAVLRGFIF